MFRAVNRFFLAILIGFGLYLVIGFVILLLRWNSITGKPGVFFDSLFVNIASDAIFFGFVGAAGVLAQFFGDSGDVLQQRVRRMFANKDAATPILNFFEGVAKENCVYAELAAHTITIVEYDQQRSAYRGEFHNEYLLRNAFGDISYDSEITVEIVPDMKRDDGEPAAVVDKLQITHQNGAIRNYLETRVTLTNSGFRRRIAIKLQPKEEALWETQWWSWIDSRGNDSGFSLKRFSARFTVTIRNRSLVPVYIVERGATSPLRIEPGDELLIFDKKNIPPKQRYDFRWVPPDGKIPDTSVTDIPDASVNLDFDGRIEEKPAGN
ncbi:hypothetical protein [Burkholderia sp. THE68]|uniref:hypothetical protein n=1 Tax=Burkholderia sp. THE68 TaxID=758782 RepID=UPI00138964A0|nr:hypothetical protein [Burkholderia sp. THE68]